ncbi:IgG-binding virulence factor TspB family protein [Neisseria shayeganii]|uniref:TspB protein n=1 Tax=Neisseria shayeganii TaxID=607712 RepID=A0A7D7N845_9NEIS|nr:IgG-binding virulence factor TspB family protein [Neisseria shayeganii]QMT40881.1 hypothetical protein H3L94_02150 [Neisseria shayeganii]
MSTIPKTSTANVNVNGKNVSVTYRTATQSVNTYVNGSNTYVRTEKISIIDGNYRRLSGNVPATVTRSARAAAVARNLLGKLRYARFTPQGLVGSLILGQILDSLIEQGYEYDPVSNNLISPGISCMSSYGVCIQNGMYVMSESNMIAGPKFVQKSDIENYFCPRVKRSHFAANQYLGDVVSCKYDQLNYVLFVDFQDLRSPNKVIHRGMTYSTGGGAPMTDAGFQRFLEPIAAQNPEAVLQAADLSDSDWSAPKVHVLPGTIVNSQPFTDSQDGKAKQARWEFYDCEKGQSCVRETLTDRPDLQPNSPAAPAPDNPPATGTDTAPGGGDSAGNNAGSGSQSGNQGEQEKDDLCRKYPHVMACDEQPEPMDAGDLSLPQKTVRIDFQPENRFPTDGQCPAPVNFQIDIMGASKTFAWEFTQACEVASRLRYLIIALAWVVAGFFCIRTVSSSI